MVGPASHFQPATIITTSKRPCHARLASTANAFEESGRSEARPQTPTVRTKLGPGPSFDSRFQMTLEQACSSEYRGAQGAFKDSMIHGKSAIHITYRDSLRSSSMREPRDPLLKVVLISRSSTRDPGGRGRDTRHTFCRHASSKGDVDPEGPTASAQGC